MGKPDKKTVKSATDKVVGLLRDEDEKIGHLTDIKVKWLVGLCNYMFNVSYSKIGVNLDTMTIYLVPYGFENGKLTEYSEEVWNSIREEKNLSFHEKDMASYLDIPKYTIEFKNIMPGNSDVK